MKHHADGCPDDDINSDEQRDHEDAVVGNAAEKSRLGWQPAHHVGLGHHDFGTALVGWTGMAGRREI